MVRVRVRMLNITFNNISVLSCLSVLLVEETDCPEKTINLSQVIEATLKNMFVCLCAEEHAHTKENAYQITFKYYMPSK
jgi:SpoU rRNA methylase family enzyme